MKGFNIVTIAMVFAIFVSNASANSGSSQDNVKDEEYENITVTGQYPPKYYKELMIQAELAFFDSYNNLTQNEDFKITCYQKEISSFSRLKKRVCESGYISNETYKGTQRALSTVLKRDAMKGNMEHEPEDLRIYKAQKKQREAQMQEMAELINSNPELYAKYMALQKAKENYQEALNRDE